MKSKKNIIIISTLTLAIIILTVIAIVFTNKNSNINASLDDTDDYLETEYANNKTIIELENNIKINGNGANIDGNNIVITEGRRVYNFR